MAIKKGDFVELNYIGKIKEDNFVFDTTEEAVAKKHGIHQEGSHYGPVIVCVGQNQVLKGLDNDVVGKELGHYEVEIAPDDGFGKKNPKLLRLVPLSKFKQQKVAPMPGLQVNIDGIIGTIKTVTGGRVIIDFNHPLSGRDLHYSYDILRLVTDTKDKVKGLLKMNGLHHLDITLDKDKVILNVEKSFPKEMKDPLTKLITEMIPEIKDVELVDKKLG